jgi:hypothetical protein
LLVSPSPDGPESKEITMKQHTGWVLSIAVALGGCDGAGEPKEVSSDPLVCPTTTADPLDTESVEWVSYQTEVPFAPGDFHALASGLFGTEAQAGNFVTHQELSPGVYVGATADPTTPAQSRVTLSFDDGTTTPRKIALVPASFEVGSTFLTTIDAAIATMQAEEAKQKGSSESFLLQYQVTSPKGGTFSFGVHGVTGVFTVLINVSTPTTNLAVGKIGTPALSASPYDTIVGTVWFQALQDEFEYFVDHAYGSDATAGQNFNDFALEPFSWLRLTVTPHLHEKYVQVDFAVLGTNGVRTPVAGAPASVLAGATFQALVVHNMNTMTAQEKAKAGSSTPWTVPFYYDAPSQGGVVQVVVQGQTGIFTVDYVVEAPHHPLQDVPFLPYKPVSIQQSDPTATNACDKLGNPEIVAAAKGAFDITFTTSNVLQGTPNLKGDLDCAVYKAVDVDISGPVNGAEPLQSFVVPNVNLNAGAPATFRTDTFPDGSYQILCFQDLEHDGNADKGDPVTLPIGSFPLSCNLNPITVQFAILDPEG